MKLLLINNEFFPIGGGGSTVTKYTAEHFVKFGYEVHLVTSSFQDMPKYEVLNGVHIHRVIAVRRHKDYCSGWELMTFAWSALWFCLRWVRKQRPDIVQTYFAVPAGAIGWILKLFYGIPYVVYLGGSDVPYANPTRWRALYPFLSPVIRTIWRGSEATVLCSSRLVEQAKKVDKKNEFTYIPNGVDLERFSPDPSLKRHEKVHLLGIGRIIKRKGFQHVIQALPRVIEEIKRPFVVEIIGTGEYKKELDRLIDALEVSQYVKFVGPVNYNDLDKVYKAADVFFLMSESEGMPLVMLEAMGCGLPVIASEVSGNEELVIDGESGYLAPPGDVKKLSEAIVKILEDDERRDMMGKRSLEIVQNYDWKIISLKYNDIYQGILRNK